MGKMKDLPCDICGESGDTTNMVMGWCPLTYCNKHNEQEVDTFRQKKRIVFLTEEIVVCHKRLAKLAQEKTYRERKLGIQPSVEVICVSPEPPIKRPPDS